MIRFVIRKMLNKKWMVLALLVGNILLVSITAGNPMYTRAVLQRTLTRNLETYLVENNAYPGLITIEPAGPAKMACCCANTAKARKSPVSGLVFRLRNRSMC